MSYDLQPFQLDEPTQFYQVGLRKATYSIPEVEVFGSKPWPLWAKLLAVGVAGRVLRIW